MSLPVHTPVGFSFITPSGIERVIYDTSSIDDIASINRKLMAGYHLAAVWPAWIGVNDSAATAAGTSAVN